MTININIPYVSRPELTDAYYQYDADDSSYIADRLFAPLNVNAVRGEIEIVTADQLTKDVNMSRAADGTYNRIDQSLTVLEYVLQEKGAEHLIPFGEQNSIQYNKLVGGARLLKTKRRISREFDAKNAMDNSGIGTTTISTKWDKANATPISDLIKARDEVISASGMAPDTIVLNNLDFSLLLKSDEVRSAFPGAAVLSFALLQEALPSLAGYTKLLVSTAIAGKTPIFSSGTVYVCRTASGADAPAETPCTGRLLYWGEDAAAEGVVEDYLSNEQRGIVLRVRDFQNPFVLNPLSAKKLSVRT